MAPVTNPHGGGFDTLPLPDCLLEASINQSEERPHQLLLTGDQIYGDAVADPLQWIVTSLGDTLLGWEEPLPVDQTTTLSPKELPAGKRDRLATRKAGFTAGLNHKREKVTSYFLSFGEYCALYLLERFIRAFTRLLAHRAAPRRGYDQWSAGNSSLEPRSSPHAAIYAHPLESATGAGEYSYLYRV
ncbi:MAG: hypothetical protein AAF959_00990 [Cyanobacteria bacterium P01_D01_bin.56]